MKKDKKSVRKRIDNNIYILLFYLFYMDMYIIIVFIIIQISMCVNVFGYIL